MVASILDNLINKPDSEGGYAVKSTGQPATEFDKAYKSCGDAERAFSILACAYPKLFPYGLGDFTATRRNNVSFVSHIRWTIQYYDRRFSTHHSFPFVAFGILQKMQALGSARVQMNRSDFERDAKVLASISREDIEEASAQEKNRQRPSNPYIRKFLGHLTKLGSRVIGSDESRAKYRSQIFGTTVTENPPNLWTTWNISDFDEPIGQVLVGMFVHIHHRTSDRGGKSLGEDISLDRFAESVAPSKEKRAKNIAENPLIAVLVFNFMIDTFLKHLFGIDATHKDFILRKTGIMGRINAYFGVFEAQGRGSLHLHMLMWFENSPTAKQMGDFLKSDEFREKFKRFISENIRAHLEGLTPEMIENIPRESHLAYSRPPHPEDTDFTQKFEDMERRIVRNMQKHVCTKNTCMVWINKLKDYFCKRKAPWEVSEETILEESGRWSPKRLHPFLNNWNPILAVFGRMNHDIKVITNGRETKDASWYMTKYSTKDQLKSHNKSALTLDGFDYHSRKDDYTDSLANANRLLLFRCFRSITKHMEYSAPQVMSYLVGYGDHIASHNYVNFYWSQVSGGLVKQYPELKK